MFDIVERGLLSSSLLNLLVDIRETRTIKQSMSSTMSNSFGEYLQNHVRPSNTDDVPKVQVLKELLESHARVTAVRKVGSSQRKTSISPVNDVDLFVVLDPTVLYEKSLVALKDVLREIVKQCLQVAREQSVDDQTVRLAHSALATEKLPFETSMLLRTQNASLGLAFDCAMWEDATVTIDLVPAIELARERYMICKDKKPLLSNPKAMDKITVALQAQNSQFVDTVRLVKKWNVVHGKPLKSFYIEVACQRIVSHVRWSWSARLEDNFSRWLDALSKLSPYRVPGVPGKCVGPEFASKSERKTTSKLLRDAGECVLRGDWRQVYLQ